MACKIMCKVKNIGNTNNPMSIAMHTWGVNLANTHKATTVKSLATLSEETAHSTVYHHLSDASKSVIQLRNNSSTVTEMKIYSGVGYLF